MTPHINAFNPSELFLRKPRAAKFALLQGPLLSQDDNLIISLCSDIKQVTQDNWLKR